MSDELTMTIRELSLVQGEHDVKIKNIEKAIEKIPEHKCVLSDKVVNIELRYSEIKQDFSDISKTLNSFRDEAIKTNRNTAFWSIGIIISLLTMMILYYSATTENINRGFSDVYKEFRTIDKKIFDLNISGIKDESNKK